MGDTGHGQVETTQAAGGAEHPISPQEIGHVVLRVRDLSVSVPFYELLGFTKVGEIPGAMAFFTATGATGALLLVGS